MTTNLDLILLCIAYGPLVLVISLTFASIVIKTINHTLYLLGLILYVKGTL